MAKISVLGAGSWGTALSVLLNNNGHEVRLWSRFQEEVDTLKQTRELTSKLPGVHIPENIDLTADVKNCVETAEVIVLAVPSPYVRGTAELMAPYVKDEQIIVNVAKGIEEKTLMTMTDIISEEIPAAGVYVLSGPSHAEEVGRGIPTTCVISGPKRETAEYLQGIFMSPVFRVYTTPDTLGVELGGSLKNVIALAAGTADGLGYGDNTKAALMTRGMYEMSKMGLALGANPHTFNGLTGMGDLIVTCTSMHSRNRRAGILIGQGKSIDQAIKEVGQVVEGIKTTKSCYELAKKYQIEMPISQSLYQVLYNNKDPKEAVNILMTRKKKEEIEQIFFE